MAAQREDLQKFSGPAPGTNDPNTISGDKIPPDSSKNRDALQGKKLPSQDVQKSATPEAKKTKSPPGKAGSQTSATPNQPKSDNPNAKDEPKSPNSSKAKNDQDPGEPAPPPAQCTVCNPSLDEIEPSSNECIKRTLWGDGFICVSCIIWLIIFCTFMFFLKENILDEIYKLQVREIWSDSNTTHPDTIKRLKKLQKAFGKFLFIEVIVTSVILAYNILAVIFDYIFIKKFIKKKEEDVETDSEKQTENQNKSSTSDTVKPADKKQPSSNPTAEKPGDKSKSPNAEKALDNKQVSSTSDAAKQEEKPKLSPTPKNTAQAEDKQKSSSSPSAAAQSEEKQTPVQNPDAAKSPGLLPNSPATKPGDEKSKPIETKDAEKAGEKADASETESDEKKEQKKKLIWHIIWIVVRIPFVILIFTFFILLQFVTGTIIKMGECKKDLEDDNESYKYFQKVHGEGIALWFILLLFSLLWLVKWGHDIWGIWMISSYVHYLRKKAKQVKPESEKGKQKEDSAKSDKTKVNEKPKKLSDPASPPKSEEKQKPSSGSETKIPKENQKLSPNSSDPVAMSEEKQKLTNPDKNITDLKPDKA